MREKDDEERDRYKHLSLLITARRYITDATCPFHFVNLRGS